MRDDIIGPIVLGIIELVLLGVAFFAGMEYQRAAMQREAVAAGVAEWVADESGEPVFEWGKK